MAHEKKKSNAKEVGAFRRAEAFCGGPRPLGASEVNVKRPGQRPGVEDQFLPDCAEVSVQGPAPCLPKGCQGVVQGAWV